MENLATPVQFVLGVNGIGDVFTAAPALVGLRRKLHPAPVDFVVRPWLVPWARLLSPDVRTAVDQERPAYHLNPDGRAELELGFGVDRHLAYARAIDVTPERPRLQVRERCLRWATNEVSRHKRPLVVLSPFSAYANRQWPLSRWLHLEDRLRTDDYGLIVLDGPGDGRRLKVFLSTYFWGMDPAEVAALVANADAVIANDSGIAHLAGTLGIPTVALCGPTSGTHVFSWYASVHPLQGPFPCSPCYWDTARGYHRACAQQCDALGQVTVDSVVEALLLVRGRSQGRVETSLDVVPDDASVASRTAILEGSHHES